MQKNSDNFSVQEAMRLAQTPAGQQLIAWLQRSDPAQLQRIMDQASAGDYAKAKAELSALMSSPEARKLLEQLGE